MDNININIPYVCPYSGEELFFDLDRYISSSKRIFKIKNNIPRFCSEENYSDSFGFQWNIFDETQLDSFSGINITYERFWQETKWDPESLEKLNVLEVGSGAGRFSEVFLKSTKAKLFSIDYSTAVDANYRNNYNLRSRLFLSQASIYQMPFKDNSFDRIFCLGVLQHTPSFKNSIKALVSKLKVNGEVVIDFYPYKGIFTLIHSKYILRPITKRISKRILLLLISKSINLSLLLVDFLVRVKLGFLVRFLPITDVRGFPKKFTEKQRKEWAIMDTFDAFSPEFDNPQKLDNVKKMFIDEGCKIEFGGIVKYSGGSSMVVRAVKI